MKLKKLLIYLPLLLLSLAVFSQSCDSSKIAISEIDSTKLATTYTLKVGDTLVIDLASNPSTGYKWEIASKIKPKIIKFIDNEYKANSNTNTMVGAGGFDTWRYSVNKKGVLYMNFKYIKEPNDIGKEKFFKIIVEE